jgi:hypothetical protein
MLLNMCQAQSIGGDRKSTKIEYKQKPLYNDTIIYCSGLVNSRADRLVTSYSGL